MSNVPNTTNFSFFDVTRAVYGDTNAGRNLTSAFADATGTFDPAYVGSKTNLLNFRNYIATIYTYTSLGNTTSTVTVCADYPNVGTATAYGLFPFVDLTSPYVIYSDFACTTPVVPTGSKWYYSDGATWIAIDGSGNVTDNGVCPTTTTTTTVAPTTTTTTTSLTNLIWMVPQTIFINSNPTRLDWDVQVSNTTASNYTVNARIMNVTQGSAWKTMNMGTSTAGTTNVTWSGVALNMLVTNSTGDTFDLQFSTDGGATYTGTILHAFPYTLPYDINF
jgi:hypothetical protein